MELHKFFESQYEQLDEIIDDVAERSRAIGHYSLGNLKQFLGITRLLEEESAITSREMLQNLLNDHETIIRALRTEIPVTADQYKDLGTCDFLTAVMEQHEKMAWFIRSYLV